MTISDYEKYRGKCKKMSDKIEILGSPPDGHRIVAMVTYRDSVYVATEYHVYRLTEEHDFRKVDFIHIE